MKRLRDESSVSVSHFNNLCDEVLVHIMDDMPFVDLFVLSITCRDFLRIGSEIIDSYSPGDLVHVDDEGIRFSFVGKFWPIFALASESDYALLVARQIPGLDDLAGISPANYLDRMRVVLDVLINYRCNPKSDPERRLLHFLEKYSSHYASVFSRCDQPPSTYDSTMKILDPIYVAMANCHFDVVNDLFEVDFTPYRNTYYDFFKDSNVKAWNRVYVRIWAGVEPDQVVDWASTSWNDFCSNLFRLVLHRPENLELLWNCAPFWKILKYEASDEYLDDLFATPLFKEVMASIPDDYPFDILPLVLGGFRSCPQATRRYAKLAKVFPVSVLRSFNLEKCRECEPEVDLLKTVARACLIAQSEEEFDSEYYSAFIELIDRENGTHYDATTLFGPDCFSVLSSDRWRFEMFHGTIEGIHGEDPLDGPSYDLSQLVPLVRNLSTERREDEVYVQNLVTMLLLLAPNDLDLDVDEVYGGNDAWTYLLHNNAFPESSFLSVYNE